jgi:hypothetical protein
MLFLAYNLLSVNKITFFRMGQELNKIAQLKKCVTCYSDIYYSGRIEHSINLLNTEHIFKVRFKINHRDQGETTSKNEEKTE